MLIGIDPGRSGGIAMLSLDGKIEILDLLTPSCLIEILHDQRITYAFIERAQSMPGQGVSSMFNYGMGYGQCLGILEALRTSFVCVHPRTWTKFCHAGTKAGDTKARSVEAANRLFPGVPFIHTGCRKPHLGMVEAALIAHYGLNFLHRPIAD